MFTPENCREWAKTASDNFIQSDIPLKATIAKVSGENDLNPTQIQRIIELANQITYARLFKNTEDKTFTFPVCQLSEVLDELKNHQDSEAEETFVAQPTIKRSLDLERLQSIFGKQEVNPLPSQERRHKVVILIEKMAAAKDEINNSIIVAEAAAHRYLKDLKTTVKQLLLDGYDKEDLLGAMLISFPDKRIELAQMFAEICAELCEEGIKVAKWDMLKTASEEVCESLVSDSLKNMGVRVVNGQHPLYLIVRDYFTKRDELDTFDSGYQFIARKIDELRAEMKSGGNEAPAPTY